MQWPQRALCPGRQLHTSKRGHITGGYRGTGHDHPGGVPVPPKGGSVLLRSPLAGTAALPLPALPQPRMSALLEAAPRPHISASAHCRRDCSLRHLKSDLLRFCSFIFVALLNCQLPNMGRRKEHLFTGHNSFYYIKNNPGRPLHSMCSCTLNFQRE